MLLANYSHIKENAHFHPDYTLSLSFVSLMMDHLNEPRLTGDCKL